MATVVNFVGSHISHQNYPIVIMWAEWGCNPYNESLVESRGACLTSVSVLLFVLDVRDYIMGKNPYRLS